MENFNLTLVYNQNRKDVLNYVCSRINSVEAAEEITSEVFIKLNRHITDGLYCPEKCSIKTYIYTITNSAVIDYLRTIKNRTQTVNIESYCDDNGNEFFQVADNSKDASEQMIDKQLIDRVNKSFDKLTDQAKTICEMYFLQQKKYIDIAEILGISLNNVKVTIFRSREILQKELKSVRKLYY